MTSHSDYDVCVIGAGVIGSAAAAELQQAGLSVLVIELNSKPGEGITSRNSEVIHSGLYYPHNSLKAQLCVEGRKMIYELAKRAGISHRKTGKIVVATSAEQEAELEQYRLKGERNGVESIRYLSRAALKELEPEVAGTSALFIPESGTISAHELCDYFCRTASNAGAEFAFRTAVTNIERDQNGYLVFTDSVLDGRCESKAQPAAASSKQLAPKLQLKGEPFSVHARSVVNAAGLYADWIATLVGIDIVAAGYELHWVKGNYFSLSPAWGKRLRHLIYPLPEKNLRGLGIHTTVDVAGQARLGPSVIEIERIEDYGVEPTHQELFFRAASTYLPNLKFEDLAPQMSGIRPKLSLPGEPARDFVIAEESERGFPGFVNLLGIESPGLTSSPAIARRVLGLIKGVL